MLVITHYKSHNRGIPVLYQWQFNTEIVHLPIDTPTDGSGTNRAVVYTDYTHLRYTVGAGEAVEKGVGERPGAGPQQRRQHTQLLVVLIGIPGGQKLGRNICFNLAKIDWLQCFNSKKTSKKIYISDIFSDILTVRW